MPKSSCGVSSVFHVHLSEHGEVFFVSHNLFYCHGQVVVVEIMALSGFVSAARHRQTVGAHWRRYACEREHCVEHRRAGGDALAAV